RCSQSTADADSYVNHTTDDKARIIIVTAIGRFGGLLPGPLSKNGARNKAPNAMPGIMSMPNRTLLPLAKSYFKNSYKNKKYQSGNGIYPIVVGSATPSNGEGCANTTVRNPTRKTEPTNHSFNKKLGQKASVLPGYSE